MSNIYICIPYLIYIFACRYVWIFAILICDMTCYTERTWPGNWIQHDSTNQEKNIWLAISGTDLLKVPTIYKAYIREYPHKI